MNIYIYIHLQLAFLCNKTSQPISNLETRLVIRCQTNFTVNPKAANFTQIKANFCRWSSDSLKLKECFTDFNCSTRYNCLHFVNVSQSFFLFKFQYSHVVKEASRCKSKCSNYYRHHFEAIIRINYLHVS